MTSQWCCIIRLSFPPFTASRQLIGGLHDFTVVVCSLSLVLTPFTESRQLIGGLYDFTATLCFLSLVPTPIYRVMSTYWQTSQWCCVICLSFSSPFTVSRQLIGCLHDFTVMLCYLCNNPHNVSLAIGFLVGGPPLVTLFLLFLVLTQCGFVLCLLVSVKNQDVTLDNVT